MHLLLRGVAIAAVSLMIVSAVPMAAQAQAQTHAASNPAPAMSRIPHRVVIQVSENDAAVMNTALNNAENLTKYFAEKGETVMIEFVFYGPGLNMVRSDTSPVKERLAHFNSNMKNVTFSGCGNTLANQSKRESKPIALVPEAHMVPTGIARIVELQEQGWTYVRP